MIIKGVIFQISYIFLGRLVMYPYLNNMRKIDVKKNVEFALDEQYIPGYIMVTDLIEFLKENGHYQALTMFEDDVNVRWVLPIAMPGPGSPVCVPLAYVQSLFIIEIHGAYEAFELLISKYTIYGK